MSLSGSAAEDYNKTGDGALRVNDSTGPEPTPENPGGVFPQVSGGPANPGSMPGSGAPDHGGDVRGVFGNVELFKETFANLSTAFTSALHTIEDEGTSGLGTGAKLLQKRLQEMQAEIDGWRMGKGLESLEQEGGEKNEDVSRPEGDAGGLYRD